MRISEHYSAWAAAYDSDRNLTRDLDALVTRELLGALRVRSILELGCGTGKNTALLAQIGAQVQALDFAPGMLARARAKLRATNVTFTEADLTQPWPCADQAVDLVVGNLVLEHIADLGFIFAEVARVLAPGGRCLISELHPFRQYLGAQATFTQADAQIRIPAYVHHISEFIHTAAAAGLTLTALHERWHAEDQGKPPRILALLFTKPS